jgi:dienelactone hydrolase
MTNNPKIQVNKQLSMIDEAIHIQVTGLLPNTPIELKATRISAGTKKFKLQSFAKFVADENGIVDLKIAKPTEGTYQDADAMGLFWSLERKEEVQEIQEIGQHVTDKLAPHKLTISLYIHNEVVDEVELIRLWKAPHIVREDVRDNGLVGTYFYHNSKEKKPGVIVVGGSEGGIYEYLAALLAAHGFNVLALGYFGVENLPKGLHHIPMEYFKLGIDWMKARAEVVEGWLGIHGTSRGAELALLTGSLFEDIRAVVALNGFAVPFAGIVPWTDDEFLPPAWTYNGEPIPYLRPENPVEVALQCKEMWKNGKGNPLGLWYKTLASDPKEVAAKAIPVERINGPVLIIGGDADSADSVGLSKMAMERLNKANFKHEYDQLIYPNAGHSISFPYTFQSFTEGTKHATNFASLDSWEKTIAFFQRSFEAVQK